MNNLSYKRMLEARYLEDAMYVPEDYYNGMIGEGMRVFHDHLSKHGIPERKILVVGGAGYIGVVLSRRLLARGYRVRCLDNLLYDNFHAVTNLVGDANYEFIHGDLTNQKVMSESLEGVTDVIILAGLVGDPITKKYPEESRQINDQGITTLIEGLDGYALNKVVFVSTCSNYGLITGDVIADETHELKPLSLYASSKVEAEKNILSGKDQVDYSATVLRFSTAFGLSGRMRFDLTVSEFTRELFVGNTLEVFDSETWRPYCHVQDFSTVLIKVLEAPVESVYFDVFNAGGDVNNYSKKMMIDEILKKMPGAKVRYVEKGSDRRNYRVDFSKIRRQLYFEPAFTVEDGISELIQVLKQGFFHDYDDRINFYRNNEIDYQCPAA